MTNPSQSLLRRFQRTLSRIFAGLPPVARRDAALAKLTEALAAEQAARPSFTRSLQVATRENRIFSSTSQDWSAMAGFTLNKFGVKELGASIGVRTPEVYGTWQTLDEIDFDSLPDAFVIKANSGANSNGVVPLFRDNDLWRVASSTISGDIHSVLKPLREKVDQGLVSGPFFVEQLLGSKTDFTIQNDIKIYSFYGQPGIAWVKKSLDFYGGKDTKRSTFFDVNGERALNAASVTKADHTIVRPEHLPEAFDIAGQISLATRLPQIRVDLFEHEGQIYLGEITPRCGHRSRRSFGQPWDEYLGNLWEHAHVRILADLALGHINSSGPVVRTGGVPVPEHLLHPPTNHG